MQNLLLWQVIILVFISVLSFFCCGVAGFLSAIAGGISYLLPSVMMVLLLKILKFYPRLMVAGFFIGEGLKVMLSLALMLIIFFIWHKTLVFLPFLLGLCAVSYSVFLVFLRVDRYGK